MNSGNLNGVYRAQVIDVRDPQKRMRCKVHVFCLHGRIVSDPSNIMYWAEVAGHTGKYCGDFFPYEVGDLVFVQFIDGEEQQPLIIGGWNSKSEGIPDTPEDKQTNYRTGRRRWTRMDRDGNTLELSEVPGENHVLLRSGGAVVKVSRLGNSIDIETVSGTVSFNSSIVNIKSSLTSVESGNVDISANHSDPITTLEDGTVSVRANSEVNFLAENTIPSSLSSTTNIGGTVDILETPHQSVNTNIRGKNINVGSDDLGLLPTLVINIKANAEASMDAPIVNVGSATTSLTSVDGISIGVGSLSTFNVVIQSSVSTTVKAPIVSVQATQFNVGPYTP